MCKRFSICAAAVAFATFSVGMATTAHAAAVDINYATYTNSLIVPGARVVGFAFNVTAPVTVTSLDAFLNSNTSAQTSSVVNLYNAAGTVFATANVTTADPVVPVAAVGTGNAALPILPIPYSVHTLDTPVTLAAGKYYVTGTTAANAQVPFSATTIVSLDPNITYTTGDATYGVYYNQASHAGSTTTNTFNDQGLTNSFFNVNVGTALAPEPATLAASSLGLASLARRRRRA